MKPAATKARTIAVLVLPMDDGAHRKPVDAVFDQCALADAAAVFIAKRSCYRPCAAGSCHTTLLLESVDAHRSGVVERAPATSDEALIACCFYHRWMDPKCCAAVDNALHDGCGVMMIVIDTVLEAAELGRAILRRIDAPLQLHELLPTWLTAGPDRAPALSH